MREPPQAPYACWRFELQYLFYPFEFSKAETVVCWFPQSSDMREALGDDRV